MKIDSNTAELCQGRKIRSGLYGGRNGIIVAIHASSPGRNEYDVAFENGSLSKRIPEPIIRGVQWEIFDEIVDADEILDALRFCSNTAAFRKEREEATAKRRADECASHLANNPHLVPCTGRGGTSAAVNIRIELKAAFPKVKFSVTSDYNTVNVRWADGPTTKQVEAIANKYKAGNFDGMQDCYEFNADATFAKVFGAAQYVFCSREDTIDGLREAMNHRGDGLKVAIPDDWKKTGGWNLPEPDRRLILDTYANCDLSQWQAPIEPKSNLPQFSKRGYLASPYGISREFRKFETAKAAADKLTAAGYLVEVIGSGREFYVRSLVTAE